MSQRKNKSKRSIRGKITIHRNNYISDEQYIRYYFIKIKIMENPLLS